MLSAARAVNQSLEPMLRPSQPAIADLERQENGAIAAITRQNPKYSALCNSVGRLVSALSLNLIPLEPMAVRPDKSAAIGQQQHLTRPLLPV